jgi:hypothetical protein
MNLMTESRPTLDSLLGKSVATFQARPLRDRRSVWRWCAAATIILGLVYLVTPSGYRSGIVLVTAIGGLWALAFYLHGQHAADARLVKELLTEFNDRYDKLGTDLQFAVSTRGDFEKETELKFVRYFNLCAEEWLFWRAGYIYDPVWKAWENGMKQYGRDRRVVDLWKNEEKTDSYYGFQFPSEM